MVSLSYSNTNPTTHTTVVIPISLPVLSMKTNRICDGVEAETRKPQASFQIIQSYAMLAEDKT